MDAQEKITIGGPEIRLAVMGCINESGKLAETLANMTALIAADKLKTGPKFTILIT